MHISRASLIIMQSTIDWETEVSFISAIPYSTKYEIVQKYWLDKLLKSRYTVWNGELYTINKALI